METDGTMNRTKLQSPIKGRESEWMEITQTQGSGPKQSWADEVEQQEANLGKKNDSLSSIWDKFDISKISNAGFKLEFVNPESVGEQRIGEIDVEDISSEIDYWQNAVVCYVLGAHPPFTVLNGYIQRIWGKHGINKIAMLKNAIVIVRFDTGIGKNEVIEGGIYHFDNKPLIVKAWNPDMEFSREELASVPIWIKLPGLDFKYWSARGLIKLGSLVGKPLMVDKNTERKAGLNFARILVEVKMGEELPEEIMFRNEKGAVITQTVTYGWKPTKCEVCNKYGRKGENCRKNKEARIEQTVAEKTTQVDVTKSKEKRYLVAGVLHKQTTKEAEPEGGNGGRLNMK